MTRISIFFLFVFVIIGSSISIELKANPDTDTGFRYDNVPILSVVGATLFDCEEKLDEAVTFLKRKGVDQIFEKKSCETWNDPNSFLTVIQYRGQVYFIN